MSRPALLVLVLLLAPAGAFAFCPSYTLSSTENNQQCGVEAVNGTNPTIPQWRLIIDEVASGDWGAGGPPPGMIGKGCGAPEPLRQVPAHFPCELFDGIAMQESGWRQFCVPDRPMDQVGGASRTIISFDCGYGVGQVTSGMHIGETPAFDRVKVAGDALYNLATGATILAGKWRVTQCVGDNQPQVIEHWYSATWAYNGLSYKNNPNNPNYSANRGPWNPSVGGGAPYQEKVFGWIEHPPGSRWTSVALAYPELLEVGGNSSPPKLSEPTCASPTDCTSARAIHVSRCAPMTQDAGTPDAGVELDAGTPDSGVEDGGVVDAGPPDAGDFDGGHFDGGHEEPGVATDAGSTSPAPPPVSEFVAAEETSGCGCTSTGGNVLGSLMAFFLAAAVRRRRFAPRLRSG